MLSAAALLPAPLVTRVRSLTVAKIDSIGSWSAVVPVLGRGVLGPRTRPGRSRARGARHSRSAPPSSRAAASLPWAAGAWGSASRTLEPLGQLGLLAGEQAQPFG